jgi:hypothetical protein
MAARLNARHQESVRSKIQATQLVKRLTSHALGKLKRPMDSSQVRAAECLLKKSLPDLSSVELTGKDGERLFDRVERVILK